MISHCALGQCCVAMGHRAQGPLRGSQLRWCRDEVRCSPSSRRSEAERTTLERQNSCRRTVKALPRKARPGPQAPGGGPRPANRHLSLSPLTLPHARVRSPPSVERCVEMSSLWTLTGVGCAAPVRQQKRGTPSAPRRIAIGPRRIEGHELTTQPPQPTAASRFSTQSPRRRGRAGLARQ